MPFGLWRLLSRKSVLRSFFLSFFFANVFVYLIYTVYLGVLCFATSPFFLDCCFFKQTLGFGVRPNLLKAYALGFALYCNEQFCCSSKLNRVLCHCVAQ